MSIPPNRCGCQCKICWEATRYIRDEWDDFYFCPGDCPHTDEERTSGVSETPCEAAAETVG